MRKHSSSWNFQWSIAVLFKGCQALQWVPVFFTQNVGAFSNERNGPIWTLNGRASEGRRRTAPLFIIGSSRQWDAKYSELGAWEAPTASSLLDTAELRVLVAPTTRYLAPHLNRSYMLLWLDMILLPQRCGQSELIILCTINLIKKSHLVQSSEPMCIVQCNLLNYDKQKYTKIG